MPSKDLTILCRNIGDLLIVLGGVLLSVIVVPIIFREYSMIPGCLIPASTSLLLGLCLKYLFKTDDVLEARHAMTIAALGWLIAPLFCAIPFMLSSHIPFLDAYFESMSGWTGTGLTMIAHPSELSHTLQFLRSFMQWLGGVGVIVLVISIITRPGTYMYALYHAEGRDTKITPRIRDTIRTIWRVYLALTAAGVGLLWLAGMPLWDSINCAMTGIGTGGFTVTDGSIAEYHSTIIEIVLIPIMLAGAIPFLVHYQVITRKMSSYVKDIQCRAIFAMVLVGATLLVLENIFSQGNCDIATISGDSVFQFVSAITCTGFQTADMHRWTPTAHIILVIAMIIGGTAGSTSGGIKTMRVVMLVKGVGWWLKKIALPKEAVIAYHIGNRTLSEDHKNAELEEVSMLLNLWIVVLIVGVVVLLYVVPAGFNLDCVILEVASAQSNVGLSTGITTASLPAAGKIMLILNMWIGRLEIIPAIFLLRTLLVREVT
ncbi:MAG: hypothetical protein C5S47_02115 [Candidatus Methanogasteraceae archaeon]|nr:MAG: hypothetical protein C5S47_02115 [ANME-2 cluster archaeon]